MDAENAGEEDAGKGVSEDAAALAGDRDRFDEAVALTDEDVEGTKDARVALDAHPVQHEHEAREAAADAGGGLDELGGGERDAEDGDHVEAIDVDAVRHHRGGADDVQPLLEVAPRACRAA